MHSSWVELKNSELKFVSIRMCDQFNVAMVERQILAVPMFRWITSLSVQGIDPFRKLDHRTNTKQEHDLAV